MSVVRAVRLSSLGVILMGAVVFLAAQPASAAQPPVGLGTADSFAVLAGTGITNTGPTTITGDVGTFPTTSETGFGSVTLTGSSTNHGGDAVTQGAKDDLVGAYNDAAGRTPATSVPVELGGSTLLAGVYTSPTFGLTGTVTLNAQGNPNAQFIFKAGSTLIAETNSRVHLINGADPCRVVWQVGSSASFRTGTRFVGDVLALTSITAETAATFQGRLLARNGAVTLDTNTITRTSCAAPSGGGTTATTTATGGTTPGGGTTAGGSSPTPTGFILESVPGGPSVVPGTPTGTPVGAPGVPTAQTPGAPGTPGSPGSPPFATTGIELFAIVAMGLALVVTGATTRTAARRRTLTNRT